MPPRTTATLDLVFQPRKSNPRLQRPPPRRQSEVPSTLSDTRSGLASCPGGDTGSHGLEAWLLNLALFEAASQLRAQHPHVGLGDHVNVIAGHHHNREAGSGHVAPAHGWVV